MSDLKILELFSGIGGMHYAFKHSGIPGNIITAIDINPIANKVYKHNFPDIQVLNKNIQNLSIKQLQKMNANTILMSPPCQPFTINGNQKDLQDPRTDAFKYIYETLIPNVNTFDYILMENVPEFEKSKARDSFIESLRKSKFYYREFVLSPTEFGIPNKRYRYYCIARRTVDFNLNESNPFDLMKNEPYSIEEILKTDNVNINEYTLNDDLLKKRLGVLDIVTSKCLSSCCFTKSYTHYCEGTGSVFSGCNKKEIANILKNLENYDKNSIEYMNELKKLKLRYFTPKEVSRLMSFPEDFNFPNEITNRQKYRLLGNSINVFVVSELIKILK